MRLSLKSLFSLALLSVIGLTAACGEKAVPTNSLRTEIGETNGGMIGETGGVAENGTENTDPETGDPAGLESQWPVRIGGASDEQGADVAVDVRGNVFAVGSTTGDLDLGAPTAAHLKPDGLVIKFDPNGKELWRRQFDVSGADYPEAALVDEEGNLYVGGQTISGQTANLFLQKYSPDGVPLWSRLFPGGGEGGFAGMTLAKGSIFLVGRNVQDIALRRVRQTDGFHDPASDVFEFAGSTGDDAAFAVAADGNGDLYVVGSSNGAFPWYVGGIYQGFGLANFDGNFDGFVMKIDADFKILETMVLPAKRETAIYGVAVNAAGAIFVTGDTSSQDLDDYNNANATDGTERFLAKFAPPGGTFFFYHREWVRQFGTGKVDVGFETEIDADGSVWMAGTESDGTDNDVTLSRHDPATGDVLLERSYATDGRDQPGGMAPRPGGGVFVTGTTVDDLFVVGFGPEGDLL